MKEEIWVKVDGFIISNFGNSKRKQHKQNGYMAIGIENVHVHRLVAKAFPEICGYWFEGCLVHHKDRDKTNNRADNLVIITKGEHFKEHHKENTAKRKEKYPDNEPWYLIAKHKKENGTISNYRWKDIAMCDLKGNVIKTYDTLNDILKEHDGEKGITSHNVRNVLLGKQKTAGGFIWKNLSNGKI